MKKIYRLLTISQTILILIAIITLIGHSIKNNKTVLKEIDRLEQIIKLKQEINKENEYLFKKAENSNIKEDIETVQNKIKENKITVETLQNKVSELQGETYELQNKILEEQNRIERERIEASTVKIEKEITYSQFPNYPTGCESVSLYILLKYNDIETSVEEIIDRLKKGALPYQIEDEMYGGNPELEFVGDPRNDYSYGVYNNPIAEVANSFKEGVQNVEGLELDQILEIVSEGRPVMVWTTIGNIWSRLSTSWIYRPTNETIYWKENEHAVVIIGYNDIQVIVSDPYTGRIMRYNRETFENNYNYMGKKAVYY